MKKLFHPAIVVIALFALSAIQGETRAEETAEAKACEAQLAELYSNLQGAPAGAMGRPGQPPVKLNDGRWYTVSDIDSIRQELHRAVRLCRDGKTHDGLNELNLVRRHFDLVALPHPESHGPQ